MRVRIVEIGSSSGIDPLDSTVARRTALLEEGLRSRVVNLFLDGTYFQVGGFNLVRAVIQEAE